MVLFVWSRAGGRSYLGLTKSRLSSYTPSEHPCSLHFCILRPFRHPSATHVTVGRLRACSRLPQCRLPTHLNRRPPDGAGSAAIPLLLSWTTLASMMSRPPLSLSAVDRMHWLFLQLFMSYVMTTSCEREQVRADTPIMIVPSPHLGNISHSVLCCLDVCTWIRSLRD